MAFGLSARGIIAKTSRPPPVRSSERCLLGAALETEVTALISNSRGPELKLRTALHLGGEMYPHAPISAD